MGTEAVMPAEEALQRQYASLLKARVQIEEQLKFAADTLSSRMQVLRQDLDADRHVNSFGEVQDLGSKVDRLCGERERILDQIGDCEDLMEQAGVPTECELTRRHLARLV